MNDLENALETIAVAVAEVEWDYPQNYAIAFETAIEVLKEKLEREQGCEYCNNGVETGSCDSDAKMRVEKGDIHCLPYIVVENDTFGTSDIFDADYCPNCGKKLKEDN